MEKATLPHNKRNCFPPYPDHYLNEITRGAPCKVEKLTKKANLTEMENLAKIANLTKIRHRFGKYSNWIVANMTKIGKAASNGKNVESGQKIVRGLTGAFWRKWHIWCQ